MAARKIELGPTGERVRQRIAELRERRGLTLAELSERLGPLGHPIAAQGISRIEQGERRVDVDDLIALALALNVSPLGLLLPQGRVEARELLSENIHATVAAGWRWAHGTEPLTVVFGDRRDETTSDEDRVVEFESASVAPGIRGLLARETDALRQEAVTESMQTVRAMGDQARSFLDEAVNVYAGVDEMSASMLALADTLRSSLAQVDPSGAEAVERVAGSLRTFRTDMHRRSRPSRKEVERREQRGSAARPENTED